jgi:four helix bundle protein
MQRFTDLKVWQRSYALALAIYRATSTFPKYERYGLTSQLCRAAVSIPTNIAEGSKRSSSVDFARFLNIAEASACEVECLLMFARDLKYFDLSTGDELLKEIDEICRMLRALHAKVTER